MTIINQKCNTPFLLCYKLLQSKNSQNRCSTGCSGNAERYFLNFRCNVHKTNFWFFVEVAYASPYGLWIENNDCFVNFKWLHRVRREERHKIQVCINYTCENKAKSLYVFNHGIYVNVQLLLLIRKALVVLLSASYIF